MRPEKLGRDLNVAVEPFSPRTPAPANRPHARAPMTDDRRLRVYLTQAGRITPRQFRRFGHKALRHHQWALAA